MQGYRFQDLDVSTASWSTLLPLTFYRAQPPTETVCYRGPCVLHAMGLVKWLTD